MFWCRFYLNIKEVKEDYRPVIWPIKYPYWCSGESDKDFIMVAYVESLDDLYKQWPEAKKVDYESVKKVTFTDRFPKPDWYEEIKEKSRSERFIEKFGHWFYLRELDFFPEPCEDYPKAFKMSGNWLNLHKEKKWLLFDDIEKACATSYAIRKSLGMEDYDFSSIIEYHKERIKNGR